MTVDTVVNKDLNLVTNTTQGVCKCVVEDFLEPPTTSWLRNSDPVIHMEVPSFKKPNITYRVKQVHKSRLVKGK